MSEGLGDFFKIIAEDKKKKKDEFRELVGEIDINSIFSEVKEEIKKDKVNSEKVEKQAAAFESWLFSETEEEKEEIVAEVAEDFIEEVDATDWRDDYVPTEIETEDLIKPEPLKPTPSVIDQSIKILDEITEETDPLNDTKFATFDDLKEHYQLFLDRISVQLSSLGGGGIEDAPKTGGPYARRNQAWEVISGGGIGTQFADNQKLNFGDNDDLQIQHTTAGTGIIQNAGTGQLQLRSNQIRLLNSATSEDYAFFNNNGSVDLYHDNVKRIETTDYGTLTTGISSATNVSIANTFTYPEYITGGAVPRAIKSQGGYDRSSSFVDYQTGTEASQDPSDYIEYTQELADSETWYRFGMSTAGNQARDNQWWGETNPQYDNTKGLFGGLTAPAGVDHFFDFSENTAFNNAQTSGSLKYTQALGSFSLKECQVGDLVLARFDFNVMPMVTNTTVQLALIYANRDANDNVTFTFPLTITPFFYGSGSVGKGFLLRPTITAYMANQQDVNSRSLVAIKADNPILVNPIGVLFTIQR
tara:strand:+ start:4224 stop:5813 length:1590 start_codon:yes stop_codon:yes gene_type:complete